MPDRTEPDEDKTVWRRNEIESPCLKICLIHPDAGLCIGCHRTRAEIATWSRMSAEARSAVMEELPAREAQLTRRPRRGRAARRSARGGDGNV